MTILLRATTVHLRNRLVRYYFVQKELFLSQNSYTLHDPPLRCSRLFFHISLFRSIPSTASLWSCAVDTAWFRGGAFYPMRPTVEPVALTVGAPAGYSLPRILVKMLSVSQRNLFPGLVVAVVARPSSVSWAFLGKLEKSFAFVSLVDCLSVCQCFGKMLRVTSMLNATIAWIIDK